MANKKSEAPWRRPAPDKGKPSTSMTPEEIALARARAEAAGRRYPNLVDNMWVLRQRSHDAAARDSVPHGRDPG